MTFSSINPETINELVSHQNELCLSIFQPTHRSFPDNKQDSIRFRNLVDKLEKSLLTKHPAEDVEKLLKNFRQLESDKEVWNYNWEGLGVLASPGMFKIFRLPIEVPEVALASDTFFTKPLRQVLQSTNRYQILGLSRKSIKMYEGNGRTLNEIELAKEIPKTLNEALGYQHTEPHTTVGSYGGVGSGASPMHHGQGGKSPEIEIDDERFFRIIAKAVYEHYSKPSKLPLILASLPEHQHLFEQVSENPYLLSGKIPHHPDSISKEELESLAWKVFEPKFKNDMSELKDKFNSAHANNLGSDNLEEISKAVFEGRVKTLLVSADSQVSGQLDRTNGHIVESDVKGPTEDDLLDDLSEFATEKGASVFVLPKNQIPVNSGIAAIYRY